MIHDIVRNNLKKSKKSKKSIVRFDFYFPENLSIIENGEETIPIFNQIIMKIDYIKKLKRVVDTFEFRLRMEKVNNITVDAIIYLLALIKNTRGKNLLRVNWYWDKPNNEDVIHLMKKSGFFRYLNTSISNMNQIRDNFQIRTGKNYVYSTPNNKRVDIRTEIVEFTMGKLCVDKIKVNYLMTMLTEMITNISDHAYSSNDISLDENWYLYVDEMDDRLVYTFLDTGVGIPTTVRKKFFENIFSNVPNDYQYIGAAISGKDYRSSTGRKERGNGLPTIYEQFTNHKIDNLIIISNRGYYSQDKKCNMNESLCGTLFYWEIEKGKYL